MRRSCEIWRVVFPCWYLPPSVKEKDRWPVRLVLMILKSSGQYLAQNCRLFHFMFCWRKYVFMYIYVIFFIYFLLCITHLLFFILEKLKNWKPKFDLSLPWPIFLVAVLLTPQLIIIARALYILLFIESHVWGWGYARERRGRGKERARRGRGKARARRAWGE